MNILETFPHKLKETGSKERDLLSPAERLLSNLSVGLKEVGDHCFKLTL